MANSSGASSGSGQQMNRAIIIPQGVIDPDQLNIIYIPGSLNNTSPLLVTPARGRDGLRAQNLPIWDDELSGTTSQLGSIRQLTARSRPCTGRPEPKGVLFDTTPPQNFSNVSGAGGAYISDISPPRDMANVSDFSNRYISRTSAPSDMANVSGASNRNISRTSAPIDMMNVSGFSNRNISNTSAPLDMAYVSGPSNRYISRTSPPSNMADVTGSSYKNISRTSAPREMLNVSGPSTFYNERYSSRNAGPPSSCVCQPNRTLDRPARKHLTQVRRALNFDQSDPGTFAPSDLNYSFRSDAAEEGSPGLPMNTGGRSLLYEESPPSNINNYSICSGTPDPGSPRFIYLSSRSSTQVNDGPIEGHSIEVDAPEGIDESSMSYFSRFARENSNQVDNRRYLTDASRGSSGFQPQYRSTGARTSGLEAARCRQMQCRDPCSTTI